MLRRSLALTLSVASALLYATPARADDVRYQKPPKAILDALNAAPLPGMSAAPGGASLMLTTPLRYPPVADLSTPMLRLAGIRIDPATNGIHHAAASTALALVRVSDGKRIPIVLPAAARVSNLQWSPNGKRFAFTNATRTGTALYVGSAANGTIARVGSLAVNGVLGVPFTWSANSASLLVRAVPAKRGPAPMENAVPTGPVAQDATGVKGTIVTYEDLLASPHDEATFAYYATSELAIVDAATLAVTRFGKPALFSEAQLSPNGKFVLAASIHRPFSYLFPYERFPVTTTVIDTHGTVVRTVADEPLRDNITPEGVSPGPRNVAWEATAPATLAWVQALDGGNPESKATDRDAMFTLAAPFAGQPHDVVHTQQRMRQVWFVGGGTQAMVATNDRTARLTTVALVDTAAQAPAFAPLWTLKDNDRYNDPGTPIFKDGAVMRVGDEIFLRGAGYGADGRKPFVDRMNLTTKAKTRIFQSGLAPLDTPMALLDPATGRMIVERQSPEMPPNAFLREGTGAMRALTAIADPAPMLRAIQRRVVTYKRPDGIDLSFTLYLPPGYTSGALPTYLWAYPAEFNDASVAGQNTNSTQTFATIGGAREAYLALAGYAVLDNASIPIVGPTRTANDTYVEQLVAGAKAAIDRAVEIGVTDRNRVGVGGHSYGAFMTANLLAHSTLFAAGVAESGAYNRSLTPFGFQNERRTYWDDTPLYTKMSPFAFATEIKAPMLMIHGMKDDNTGTFPIQSERMFAAIKGNGGVARLVMLPNEAHGYLGRETIETVIAETVTWMDKYVKNAPKATAATTP